MIAHSSFGIWRGSGLVRTLAAAVLFLCSMTSAETGDLTADVVLDKQSYAAGDTVIAALQVTIPDNFHLYGNPLGPGIGKPVMVSVRSGQGIHWLSLRKTPAKRFDPEIGDWVWAYEKKAYFFFTGIIDKDAPRVIGATVYLNGLVCHTSCLPVNTGTDFEVMVADRSKSASFENAPFLKTLQANTEPMDFGKAPGAYVKSGEGGPLSGISIGSMTAPAGEKQFAWEYEPAEKKMTLNFLLAIILGFIAGIILNVMPCVLPVIGIKILSFAKAGGASRRSAVARSLVFSGGIMTVFMSLAALASFAHLSWGQQFQSPWFLVSLIVLTVVFALGLFDVYMLIVPSDLSNLERKSGKGYAGEFLRGMFATLLATPCSGPFLGATLAWTLTQPAAIIFLVFASIGAGMGFPYVLLSASKTLVRIIPKPGKWMEDFKHLMGIVLLGSAVYFLLGLPKDMVVPAVGFSIAIAFAVVLYFRYAPFGSSLPRKATAACIALLFAGFGYYLSFDIIYKNTPSQVAIAAARNEVQWEDFSPKLLLGAHANGQHVIVDFTANWCLNCQYNMMTVLSSKEVTGLINKKHILALKADLTWTNAAAESLLHHLGSRSVPFFAVFPGDDPYHPVIMRDILNKGAVMKVLKGLEEK